MTEPARPSIEETVRAFFEREPDAVAAVYLFGSHARGEAKPGSDVDVGLLFASAPRSTIDHPRFRIADDLGGVLGRRVDVTVMNDAPVDLVHRILRDGVLLVDRDRSHRIAFEVRARNEYFDLKPILDRYRRVPSRPR